MHRFLDSLAHSESFSVAVEQFRSKFERELAAIRGVGPSSDRGREVLAAAVRLVEALVGGIQRDLQTERSKLQGELASAKARVDTLERQLDDTLRSILDAQRHRKPGLIRTGLLALGGFLAGIGSGFAQGAGDAMYSDIFESDDVPAVAQLSVECLALDQALDESGAYVLAPPDHTEANSTGDRHDSTDRDRDEDLASEDPWLSIPVQLRDEYLAWREAGFVPEVAVDWQELGFTANDALRWIAYGFEPTEARAWIDRAHDGDWPGAIEPSLAAEYSEHGLSPDRAMQWRDYDFDPDEAAEWEGYGFEPESAAAWREEGFDAEAAEEWHLQNLDPQDARLNLGGTAEVPGETSATDRADADNTPFPGSSW